MRILCSFHGQTSRFRHHVTVEVFDPRRGIVSEYVPGDLNSTGDAVRFSIQTDCGWLNFFARLNPGEGHQRYLYGIRT